MCGIAALIGERASRNSLERMLAVAARRGPERTRCLTVRSCQLGHAALRFVDVGNNEQPCVIDNAVIVWNGEIYNWRALWPSARNDTHALVNGLRAQGDDFLKRIDGQFAFVALMGAQLWIGRDKWGICPLAFGHTPDGCLAIGSTTETVQAAGVQVVKSVPAGTMGVATTDGVEFRCWYRVPRASGGRRADPRAVRSFAETRVRSRIPDDPSDVFTAMGGMDSQFVTACVARHTRGEFGGAVTVVPTPPDAPGSDYPQVRAMLDQLASEGIAMPHYIATLTHDFVRQNLDRLLKLLGPDLFHVLCGLGEDLVAATVRRLGGRTILTAGGPDEAGRSYDRWTFIHRGLDEERAWQRLAEQFSSSEGVRAGLVFGERGIENRVPLADLIDLATEFAADEKQRVVDEGDGEHVASMRMHGKIFWKNALRGVIPDVCIAAAKEPIHGSIGSLPLVAQLAHEDAAYQSARQTFALWAFTLGWNGIVFADLRTLDPTNMIPECQLYALYRWSLIEPTLFQYGGPQRYGTYFEYLPRSADDPLERVHKPLCYDWQLGRDVRIRPIA